MTATASRHTRARAVAVASLVIAVMARVGAEGPAMALRAVTVGRNAALTIDLFRWSTESERAPLLTALAPPAPAPPATAGPAAGAAGRGGRAAQAGRGARGGGGGRGGAAAATPVERLAAAVKSAPTHGFIWSDGVTGYSIKYAWRTPAAGAPERIVLVTDRRLAAHLPDSPPSSGPLADADFTVLEIRLDATGAGEGKASLTTNVVLDAAAQTLALDGYAAAPVWLKVTR